MAGPESTERTELVIIGGGIAGAAAALRTAQNHLPSFWVLGDTRTHKASRSAYVRNVDNMVGVHPDIVRSKAVALLENDFPDAAARLREAHLHISTEDLVVNVHQRIAEEFGQVVQEVGERAETLDRSQDEFCVKTTSGRLLAAPAVILATGVSDRQPVIHRQKGEKILAGIHWLFPYANHETLLYCIRCEGHLTTGQRVAVIGAEPATAEVALMIRERYQSQVVILTAGEEPRWNQRRSQLLAASQVEIIPGRLTAIDGKDKGATLHGFTIEGGRKVEVDLAFVAMGLYRVAHDLARGLGPELEDNDRPEEERHLLVDDNSETSVPGLFAIGDMTRHRQRAIMKQVYTAQEYAVRAVDRVDGQRRHAARKRLMASTEDAGAAG
jgi:thioredoxin reductase (NADPH)